MRSLCNCDLEAKGLLTVCYLFSSLGLLFLSFVFGFFGPSTLLLRARPQCRQELYSVLYRGVNPAILHRVTAQYFTPQRATPSTGSNVIDLTGDDDDTTIDLTLDDHNTTA